MIDVTSYKIESRISKKRKIFFYKTRKTMIQTASQKPYAHLSECAPAPW